MHQSASHNIPFLTREKQVCPCSEDIKCPMFSSEQELSMTGLVSPRTELLVSKELESRKFIHTDESIFLSRHFVSIGNQDSASGLRVAFFLALKKEKSS